MDSMLWKGSGQSDLKQVIFEQNGGSMFLIVEKKDRSEKWKLENALKKTENAVLYHGLSVREMLFSGEDLLAEEILRTGCLDRQCLEGLFPQVNGYALLGSAASWSGLTVHLDGEIRLQTTGGSDNTFCLFHPRQIHPQIGAVKPCFSLLDDYLPILVSCYEGQNGYMLLVPM